MRNICKFLSGTPENGIHIIHFVYETQPQVYCGFQIETLYKMHLVSRGSGRLHTPVKIYELKAGDLFFTFPSMPCALESEKDFEYYYISCIGQRVLALLEMWQVSKKNLLFHGLKDLLPLWQGCITQNSEALDLRCEAIMLYSFSALEEQTVKQQPQNSDIVLRVKKYIEEHFSDPNLSLKKISMEFLYNEKYLSTVFKKQLQMGITQYITALRIQQACTLMDQGFGSVKDIAFQCGFSEPLYFSKVFKSKMGCSPKIYLQNKIS